MSLDDFTLTDPTGADNLNTAGKLHSTQHGQANAALRDLKTRGLRTSKAGGSRLKGGVIFSFDDATIDHFTVVRPLFNSRGLKTTFYIPTGPTGPHGLDRTGYMTSANVQTLIADGHEIGAHCQNHASLGGATTVAEIEGIVLPNKTALEALGATVRTFAATGGQHNKLVRDVITDYFDVMRLTGNLPGSMDIAYANAFMQTHDLDGASEANIKLSMDEALANDRVINLVGHVVSAGGAVETKIAALLDYATTIGLPVLTTVAAYDQVVERKFGRRGGTLGKDGSVGATRVATVDLFCSNIIRTYGGVRIMASGGNSGSAQGELRVGSGGLEIQGLRGNSLSLNPEGNAVVTPTSYAFSTATTSGLYRVGTTSVELRSNNNPSVRADSAQVDGETAMLLRVNRAGTATLDRVTVGAPDSGGTGFRVLRVAN